MNNRSNSFGNDTCKEIVDNVCPHCGEHLLMNKRSFANHVRWCKKNPRYEEILKSTKDKCKQSSLKIADEKYGEIKTFHVKCCICGNDIEIKSREFLFDPSKRYYCSTECAHAHNILVDGVGKKISDGFKNKSERYKEYYKERFGREYDDNLVRVVSKNNQIKKKCPICGNEFETTRMDQICCSRECGVKMRVRNMIKESAPDILNCTEEEKIKWLKSIYRKICQFKFGLSDYPEEFDFELIKENGWYKAKNHGNNLYGVSRDHKFSCGEGFKELIDPYLISHPANCQLLLHSDNVSKFNKCSITLDELKELVKKWNDKYGEYENHIDYKLFDDLGIKFQRFQI